MSDTEFCAKCGKQIALVGRIHLCEPPAALAPETKPPVAGPRVEAADLAVKVEKIIKAGPRKIGRPRIEDRAKTLTATEPWKAAGMSRRSWYRRQRDSKPAT
jgi:hypothetical protein